MPGQRLAAFPGEQLRMAGAVAESKSKPRKTRENYAASHEDQLVAVTGDIGSDNCSVRAQRERSQAGKSGLKVFLLSQAFGQPHQNGQNAPEMREWHLQNQENTEHHQYDA